MPMTSDPKETQIASGSNSDAPQTIENAVEHAKRAFALKRFEQAVDHYATALELVTQQHGEKATQTADLYFSYGKALLENAMSQNSVLGKEQPEDGVASSENKAASGSGTDRNGPVLSFSGDAEDSDDLPPAGEDVAVDMFGEAVQAVADEEADGEEVDEEAEPEDDFNAAWEVLDLARAIYNKQKDEDDDEEVKLKLADTYIALGDVSLETEKFDQAITDYEAGLALKSNILPVSSRQIAEAHYKLSMVLDLTSGRLADAIVHAEKALESVETRSAELRDGLNGQLKAEPAKSVEGKSEGARLVRDLVQNMSKPQIEVEIKELEGLKQDLALKVDELKTTPSESIGFAPALAAQALDKELNSGASSAALKQTIINDLTGMVVKKKKKAPQDDPSVKRKADDDAGSSNFEKKAKLDS